MDKEIDFYKLDELNMNFDLALYLYNLNMEYEFKKNATKILEAYNTAQPNIELSNNINEIALKLIKDKRYKNPFITTQNIFINRELNLFFNTVVKYSYYALQSTTKIDKINYAPIAYFRKNYFSLRLFCWETNLPYNPFYGFDKKLRSDLYGIQTAFHNIKQT